MKRIYQKNPDVVYRVIAGEAILLPITRETQAAGRMLTLNEVGAFIWERLDGKRTLSEIAGEIGEEYEVEEETAEKDLRELIEKLEKMGAIIPTT